MDAFNENFNGLPFDVEAEQSVLGALLLEPNCMSTVLEYVTVDCFYKEQHRELFSLMLSMFSAGETMDFITVLGRARSEHIFDSDEQAKLYLTQLVQIVPTTKNVDEYAKIIDKVSNITNLSYYQRLTNLKTLETKLEVSDADTYIKWSSDIKSKYLVIEFEFTEEQDTIVYEGGNTRVISYYCLSYVITKTKGFTDVLVYYSTTNSSSSRDESYAKCQPLILKGFVLFEISISDNI
jgi:hypothetical protein